MDCRLVLDNIQKFLMSYIKKSGVKSLVIGLSGGIDSALVTAISREPCDLCGIQLIGISLPSKTNKQCEIDAAKGIGVNFCHVFGEIYIDDIFEKTKVFLDSTDDKIRLGNCKARIRMIKLYDIAKANNGLVLSTDNLTELKLGFWTLHGDVGDLGLIQNLWKTEVYELAQYIVDNGIVEDKSNPECRSNALSECIKATPTDGLGISNSDLDQICEKSYKRVDEILQAYNQDHGKFSDSPVIHRHLASSFKRENPINIRRGVLFMKNPSVQ